MRASNADTTRPAPANSMPGWLAATLLLLAVAVAINYVDRGNLATAAPLLKDELGLSATQLGFLLTAFFITYMPMQIVVGWLADRFGPSRVLVTGFVVWSAAMALTGLAQAFVTLVVLRLLLGLGESVSFPATASIIATWFPESRRGFANAVVMAGLAIGPAFGIFFGGLLIVHFGWRAYFVGFGLVSLPWTILWLAIAHPQLANRQTAHSIPATDNWTLLREPSLWGASLGHFCSNYALYFVQSWIPYYLVHERAWSVTQMAKIGGCAYLLMAATSLITGWLSDHWIRAGSTATRVRKSFLGTGLALAAICTVACALASSVEASAVLLLLTCGALGLTSPNTYAVGQTLAGPKNAGRWTGIQNCLANIAGLIAPFLTGVLVDRTGSFLSAFIIAAAVSVLGAIAWIFGVGRIEPIDWTNRKPQARAAPATSWGS